MCFYATTYRNAATIHYSINTPREEHMTTSLTVSIAGIDYSNPFLLSSAPPTTSRAMIERAFELGWGGAVIKTLAQVEPDTLHNVSPRIQGIRSGGRLMGFTNIELGTQKSVEHWLEDIAAIKKRFPDRVLIASMLYGGTPLEAQWRTVAAQCQQAGADALELNFSCPHGCAESGGLAEIGTHPETMAKVLGWVRASTTLPIYAKLPPFSDIIIGSLTCAENGANGISLINTISSIPGIDIETGKPLLAVQGQSAFGGMSGRMVKPIALRCVAQAAQTTQLAVSGMGGIYTWQDAVEFMLVGASTVQVCSAVMEKGYGIIEGLCEGLRAYLKRKGLASPQALTGRSLPYFRQHKELTRTVKVQPCFAEETCKRCGLCSTVCRDSGYQAIHAGADGLPSVTAACTGCGLCAQVCPVGSIRLIATKK